MPHEKPIPHTHRTWTAWVAGLAFPLVSQSAGTTVAVLSVVWIGILTSADATGPVASAWIMAVAVATTSATLLTLTWAAASRSDVPLAVRLSLSPAGLAPMSWILVVGIGIALAQGATALATASLGGASSSDLSVLLDPASPVRSAILVGSIAVFPGVAEEVLFRGYVLQRFLTRGSAAGAIVASTLLFAFAHLHPVQILTTIPVGLWLGWVAWRTGSVWPAIGIHVINNAAAAGLVILGDPIGDHGATGAGVAVLVAATGGLVLWGTDPRVRADPPSLLDRP